MGMTIDDAIAEVEQQKLDYQEFWEEYKNEHIEALDMAIDTMRKYEKILDIIHCYNRYTDDAAECIENLREVIEDGND